MDDKQIIELYFARDEEAIAQTASRYGRFCHYVARQILQSDADAEEIVNDTYLKAWNTIPPQEPKSLKTYLGMIANQLAINRYYAEKRQKRGGGSLGEALDELDELISDGGDIADEVALSQALNKFLAGLGGKERNIFVRRYWYASAVKDIAAEYRVQVSYVTVSLLRTRRKLKDFLQKEGFEL